MLCLGLVVIEVCPSCGSSQPHNGVCPALQGATVLQANADRVDLRTSSNVLQNRYELLHVLGQGGMGTVYMARDLRLSGRNCVVKKLRNDFYREEDRQKAKAFFEREKDMLAGLSELHHHNIVQVLDYFSEGDDHYLVMEYVQGNNLHFMLHEERHGEPFSEDTVIGWALQICDVLSYMHAKNPPVIYRDLKPSNVMIDLKGEVKLVDFGIARPYDEQSEHTHVVSAGYSPPEQYWGAADTRSDVYSLGATMHFLLTGHDPEALHISSPQTVNPDVSDYIDQLVQKATSQELEDRFQTVEEFMEALLHKDYVPAPESPRSRVGEILTGVILLVVALVLWFADNLNMTNSNKAVGGQNQSKIGIGSANDPIMIDERSFKQNPTGSPPRAQINQTDLAAQVMDEKDLTDPAGLQPLFQKRDDNTPGGAGGLGNLNIPWLNNNNGNNNNNGYGQ